jgi:acyl carrier protein
MLNVTEIQELVSKKIFSLTGKKNLSAHEELVASGILTSITIAELAVELEKVFELSFSFMEVSKENFSSVEAISRLIQKKKQDVF